VTLYTNNPELTFIHKPKNCTWLKVAAGCACEKISKMYSLHIENFTVPCIKAELRKQRSLVGRFDDAIGVPKIDVLRW